MVQTATGGTKDDNTINQLLRIFVERMSRSQRVDTGGEESHLMSWMDPERCSGYEEGTIKSPCRY